MLLLYNESNWLYNGCLEEYYEKKTFLNTISTLLNIKIETEYWQKAKKLDW